MLDFNDHEKNPQVDNSKFLSIIIPTFNESKNIISLLKKIESHIPDSLNVEIIVVDDNSPDGTGDIVDKYISCTKEAFGLDSLPKPKDSMTPKPDLSVKIIHRQKKSGLIAALLNGINSSQGKNVIIMDADFSHPPEMIERMIKELKNEPDCIIVGSRYVNGGFIEGMPLKRLVLSIGATLLARYGLCLRKVCDPMSGFFAFPKHALENVEFNTGGFKILLELLIKKKGTIKVKEIPYTFKDRRYGQSKLDFSVIRDYMHAVWKLYLHGRKSKSQNAKAEQKRIALFLSKAARFYTVGASGLALNYFVALVLSNGLISNMDYMHSTSIGIALSVTTNFILNKIWTFEDRTFSLNHFVKQYLKFVGLSSFGILIQFVSIYMLKEAGFTYDMSLLLGVIGASISNFLFNKKWTFKERIWG
ncbi:MAG: glycosyltransferase family 2 protein [Thermoproteota archaeon]|nr:glycosyltransferase family 2 protein [Thermoproteota archaeon]